MPELPELAAFSAYVKTHCLHKTITDVTTSDSKVIHGALSAFKKGLIGKQFSHTERMGKYLVIDLPDDKKLAMHFGLTGSLVYTKNDAESVRFSVVQFIFKDGSVLHWTSIRKFGKLWLLGSLQEDKFLKKLGPDALKISLAEFLSAAEKNKSKNCKAFLMDQAIIAGIGNEYSDEILFQAGIDPHHAMKDLSKNTLTILYKEMHTVLTYACTVRIKSIKKNKENFSMEKDRDAFKASYLQAHRHVDMVCPKNKNHKLKKSTIAGRTSYYCPEDQI